jgi:hypothetical protein
MATVNRGDTGEPHEVRVIVCTPYPERAMIDDVVIACSILDNAAEWGFPVTLALNRDEALELCSQLVLRLKTPKPPKPVQGKRFEGGERIDVPHLPNGGTV